MVRLQGFIVRFDENDAVIAKADRSVHSVCKSYLPSEAKIGDFIVEVSENHFVVDPETTEKRNRDIRLMTECFLD